MLAAYCNCVSHVKRNNQIACYRKCNRFPAMNMPVGSRLRSRLAETGVSQSELARRVGVSQGTIAGLLSGKARSSSHLHVIARELGTTPAYLSGETDDPSESVPPEPSFDRVERELILGLRELQPGDRAALLRIANSLRPSPPPERALPPEGALADMFEALLMGMDRTKPLDEQALLLAQRLPIGLSQLKGLVPPRSATEISGAAAAEVAPKPQFARP